MAGTDIKKLSGDTSDDWTMPEVKSGRGICDWRKEGERVNLKCLLASQFAD